MSAFNERERESISPNQRLSSLQRQATLALHDTVSIADKSGKYTTYQTILEIANRLSPDLFGRLSLLETDHESEPAIEYRQRADLESLEKREPVLPLDLVKQDITKWQNYLSQNNVADSDAVLRRLNKLISVRREFEPIAFTEHRLIARDMAVGEDLPYATKGGHYLDLALPRDRVLRLRLIHPDAPEDITGIDILYEHHNIEKKLIRLAAIQYKIWENQTLYTSQSEVEKQIAKLECTFCQNNFCSKPDNDQDEQLYRMKYCSAFLRPTNKTQNANSRLASVGYHVPICRVKQLWEDTKAGKKLRYDKIKNESLTQRAFEELFCNEMLGSRWITYASLQAFYDQYQLLRSDETLTIYAQDFTPTPKVIQPELL